MVYFRFYILEPFELKILWLASPVECILGFDELLCLFLRVSVSDFNVVTFGGVIFLEAFEMMISALEVVAGIFTEVIVNDSFNWSLRSVWFAICELFFWKSDLLAAIFKCVHTEWNSVVMSLPILVVLRSCNVSINNWFIIQQFEISGIASWIFFGPSWLMYFPWSADLGSTFLGLLIRSAICEIHWRQSPGWWLAPTNIILNDKVVSVSSEKNVICLSNHLDYQIKL